MGLALTEILSASTSSLPPARAATGSALVNASRQLGAVVGVSLAIAILGSPATPEAVLDAFRDAWWAVAAVALAGAVVALGMTPRTVPAVEPAAATR